MKLSYGDILDRVLGVERWLLDSQALVVVRFLPSFGSESQLVFRYMESGGELTYIKLEAPLTRTLEASPASAAIDDIIGRIRYKRYAKSFDAKSSRQMLEEFWDAWAQSPTAIKDTLDLVQLDGARYDIRVYTNLASISMVLSDADPRDNSVSGDVPVVRWANALRLSMAN